MSVPIQHELRKQVILKQALAVFAAETYAGTTFQKIADACDISRTILYLYFPNKQAIFRHAIRELNAGIGRDIERVNANTGLSVAARLDRSMFCILEACRRERALFRVILEYLSLLARRGGSPGQRVRAQTATARRLFRRLLTEGVRRGELVACDIPATEALIFALLQAAALRLALLDEPDLTDLHHAFQSLLERLKA